MLKTILIVLFFMQHGASDKTVEPLGSILFEDHGFVKKCFVRDDVALLATRMKFQELLPNASELNMWSDDGVMAIIKYFYGINELIETLSADDVRILVQKSFYDLLGR